jgi:hypothetical protein
LFWWQKPSSSRWIGFWRQDRHSDSQTRHFAALRLWLALSLARIFSWLDKLVHRDYQKFNRQCDAALWNGQQNPLMWSWSALNAKLKTCWSKYQKGSQVRADWTNLKKLFRVLEGSEIQNSTGSSVWRTRRYSTGSGRSVLRSHFYDETQIAMETK